MAEPGDLEGDGDVDLDDYTLFADCMDGPDVAPRPSLATRAQCLAAFDFDADGDVDLADARSSRSALTIEELYSPGPRKPKETSSPRRYHSSAGSTPHWTTGDSMRREKQQRRTSHRDHRTDRRARADVLFVNADGERQDEHRRE